MNKQVFAMIHVQALPGTPGGKLEVKAIVEHAKQEAKQLLEAGFDGLIIENMHDVPYLKRKVGPEIVAGMTAVSLALREFTDKPLGIQVLAGANKDALAIAHAAGLDFIRAEGFVFGHIADEGYMDAQAGELMRYRKAIGAEGVKVYVDVKKKHSSHAITGDVNLLETIHAAELFLCDGVIVTGTSTGKAVDIEELESVTKHVKTRLCLGSGISTENIEEYWNLADCFIVGSYIKKDHLWSKELDQECIIDFIKKVEELKQSHGS